MTKVLLECIGLSMAVALTLGCSAYFFGNKILWIYTDDVNVVKAGMEVLRFTTITYFLCGIMDLLPGALRGMGYSTVPMILSVIGTVGTRLVWIYDVFPYHRSIDILFISYPASWFVTIVFQVICYFIVRKRLSLRRDKA